MVHLVGLGDCDPMVFAFDLAPVQLTGEGCDMRVGHVTPRRKEVCLDVEIILGYDDVPRLELLDHCLDGMIFATDIVLLYLFDLSRIDGCADGFDRHGIHHLLEGVLLPSNIVVLLELEEIAPLGVVLNFLV